MNVGVPAFEQVTVLPANIGGVISVHPGFATTGKIFTAPIDETAELDAQTRAFLLAIMVEGVACVIIFARIAAVLLDDPTHYNQLARTIQDRLTVADLVSTRNVRYVSAGIGDRPWHEMTWPNLWEIGDPSAEELAGLGAGPAVLAYLRNGDFGRTVRGMADDEELARLMLGRRGRQSIAPIGDELDGLRWSTDGRNDP